MEPRHAALLRGHYEERREQNLKGHGHHLDGEAVLDSEREVIAAEREALVALRRHGQIDNVTLRRLQYALDMAELEPSVASDTETSEIL
jgi:hypothetical protein